MLTILFGFGRNLCEETDLQSSFSPVFAVLDDEDSNNITAGSIVTVTVTLTRKRMVVRIPWGFVLIGCSQNAKPFSFNGCTSMNHQ